MARSDTLRAELARLQGKTADLTKEASRHEAALASARSAAEKKRSEASRTKSDSTRRSATSAAEREDKKALDALKKLGDVQKRAGDHAKTVGTKQQQLAAAAKSEAQVAERASTQQASKERSTRQARDRDDATRHRRELAHAREIGRAASQTTVVRFVEIRTPQPEPLRVLYLTSNPQATETTVTHPDGTEVTEGVWLRVDREVRLVKEALRGSKYRDQIVVEHLPAATTKDVLDGLNDHRPHVVHFSGHGGFGGLLMDNERGDEDGQHLDFAILARMLSATTTPPTLLVLNACDTLAGVDQLLPAVPVVIAMSDTIPDLAAMTFASQFYGAIAAAQSISAALEQAKTIMSLGVLEDAELPQVACRDDIDITTLTLVQARD